MARIVTIDKGDKRIRAQLAALRKLRVTVGVHGKDAPGLHDVTGAPGKTLDPSSGDLTMPELATIHEFGTARVPERSFIRAGIDAGIKGIGDAYAERMADLVTGKADARDVAETVGLFAVGAIHTRIESGIDPPLAPATRAIRDAKAAWVRKPNAAAGEYTPLRDTGQLIQSLTYRVEGGA